MKGRWTLKTLRLVLATAAVLPLLIFSVYQSISSAELALKRASSDLASSAVLVASNQEQMALAAQQLLIAVAQNQLMTGASTSECSAHLAALGARLPQYASISIASIAGDVICHSTTNRQTINVSDRPYFQQAVSTRKFSVGQFSQGRVSGKPTVQFALPVITADDTVTAVAFVSLDLQTLADRIAQVPLPEGGRLIVADSAGVILAMKPAEADRTGTVLRGPTITAAVQDRNMRVGDGLDVNGQRRIYAFQPASEPLSQPFFVSVSQDRDVVLAPVQRQAFITVAVLLLTAVLGTVLAAFVAGREVIEPTRQILAGLQKMQQGQRNIRIPVRSDLMTREVNGVADGVNLMAQALELRERDLQTELVRSQQALSTLDLTINSMKEGLIAVNIEGAVILFNNAAAAVYVMDDSPLAYSDEWSSHHGLYLPGTDLLVPADHLPLSKALRGETGSTQHLWVRNARHAAGRLISCSFRPMYGAASADSEAPVIGALMVFSDITQLQKMQIAQAKSLVALNESQRQLLQAQQLGRMASYEFDAVTQKLSWSDEVYELFDLSPESFDGNFESLIALMHPEDRLRYDHVAPGSISQFAPINIQYRIQTPAGNTRWIHQYCIARDGENGVNSLRTGMLQDITDVKQAEQQLRETNKVLSLTQSRLLDALRVGRMGNWEIDIVTQELWMSDELYHLCGLDKATFDSQPESLMALVHPDDRTVFHEARQHAWREGSQLELEYRFVTPAGDVRWVHHLGISRDGPNGAHTLRRSVVQDITARKEAELALKASYDELAHTQKKLVTAQKVGRIGNWEYNLLTDEFSASAQFYAICGVKDQSLGRTELMAMVHPEDQDTYLSSLALVTDQLDEVGSEAQYRILTPAGDVRWIQQMARVERDACGQAVRRIGVIQDITEREEAKRALAESLDLLKRTNELSKIGGWEFFIDEQRLVSSDQLRYIHELEEGQDHTLEIARTAYPLDVRQQFLDATKAAREIGTSWSLDLPMVTQRGRSIWVRTKGQAVWENGRITRLVGSLQDITEKQEAREKLQLMQASMNRMTDVVLVTKAQLMPDSKEREIVYANDAFERFTGYDAAEMIGQSPMLLDGPLTDRQTLRELADALRLQRTHRCELYCYKKSGEAAWMELDIVPIFDRASRLSHWVWVARDLTARKAAEQALMQSEQRYMALFDAAPLPLWVYDEHTLQFLAVNAAASEQYGFTHTEFLAMTVLDIRHERERARAKANFGKSTDGESLVTRHLKKNGQEFDAQVKSRPIQYEGRAGRFVIALDATARIKAEKAVQDQLFLSQRAADAAQAITSHQTLQGAMQEVADQACGVVGAHQALVMLTEGDAWNPSIYGLSLSEKYAKYRSYGESVDGTGIYALVSETKQPVRLTQAELEAHPRWRDFGAHAGKHPAMRGWLAVPMMGRNGTCIGVLQLSDKFEGEFTLLDEYVVVEMGQLAATALENARLFDEIRELNAGLEEKVVERTAALTRQEALFRALADEAPQAIWTITAASEVSYVNRAFLEIVGGVKEDWLGKTWLTVIHPEDLPELLRTWEMSVRGESAYANLRRVRHHQGGWRTMSCTASPVFDESGKVDFWVGIDSDITDIKATEAALRLSNQELEAFSYSVSHDLRSPLNTIDGFSRLLAKHVPGDANDKARHYLTRIQAGVAQMGRLIEDLLSLAQVSRMQLKIEKVDLSAVALTIVDEWRVRAPERHVVVLIEPGIYAHGDARLLRVVMENLLGNAWKFTSQRDLAEITVGQTHPEDGRPAIFVRDNGAGFDMAYADKLFTAFQRLHAVQDFPGTGIGLATVSRVIGRHGGQLWADAKPERGACFYFTLANL